MVTLILLAFVVSLNYAIWKVRRSRACAHGCTGCSQRLAARDPLLLRPDRLSPPPAARLPPPLHPPGNARPQEVVQPLDRIFNTIRTNASQVIAALGPHPEASPRGALLSHRG